MKYTNSETLTPSDQVLTDTPVCVRGLVSHLQSIRGRNRPKTIEDFEKQQGVVDSITYKPRLGAHAVRMECQVDGCEAACVVGEGHGQQGHGLYVVNYTSSQNPLLAECVVTEQPPVIELT